MKQIIIFEMTEAVCPERRGIGVQMRSWLEAAPFEEFPETQFLLVNRETSGEEHLRLDTPNVRQISRFAKTEKAYIDQLYQLGASLIFFPLADQKYVRQRDDVKIAAVDYGMEDFYCRDYVAPRQTDEILQGHELALRRYDCIITVSKTSQRDLLWFFPEHKGKIEVIYPGIARHADVATAAKQLPNILQEANYFLVFGYEQKKNIIRIAEAFDRFKKQTGSTTKLALAGKPGYGGEVISRHLDDLACAGDIVRLGYVGPLQKQALICRCQAVVALSVYEGFGLSALEALEAGKIVLVSDNGSLREVVGRAGYLADPFSVESMTAQFRRIDGLKDNPKKQYIPERLAFFSQQKQARKLLDYLVNIV